MRIHLLIIAIICLTATGCNNGTKSDNISSTDANTTTKMESWDGDEWERLSKKISDGDLLVAEEWAFIFDNIEKADGGYSEDMGYALFKSLKGNIWYNNQLASSLNTLEPAKREVILCRMIDLMSIDLEAEGKTYTWLEFVDLFPIFLGSSAAESQLEQIYNNIEATDN